VGTLPKKSGDPSFRLCCGSPFSNIICLELYNEYDTFLPSDQVALLQLWDEISLPHEEVKQICGTCIPIIGFEVDPNAMSVRMSEAKQSELIDTCTASLYEALAKLLESFKGFKTGLTWH
jgi:hypothetical protein